MSIGVGDEVAITQKYRHLYPNGDETWIVEHVTLNIKLPKNVALHAPSLNELIPCASIRTIITGAQAWVPVAWLEPVTDASDHQANLAAPCDRLTEDTETLAIADWIRKRIAADVDKATRELADVKALLETPWHGREILAERSGRGIRIVVPLGGADHSLTDNAAAALAAGIVRAVIAARKEVQERPPAEPEHLELMSHEQLVQLVKDLRARAK